MKQQELIKSFQKGMNAKGASPSLVEDGIWGPKTTAEADKVESVECVVIKKSAVQVPNQPTPPSNVLSITAWFEARMGWSENNAVQDRELAKGWALTRWCKAFTTCKGNDHAWCGMSMASACNAAGFKYPLQCETAAEWKGSGTAYDWKKTGIKKGSIVVIGTSHVTSAYEDTAPGASSVKCLGGNQSDSIRVSSYATADISYVGLPIPIVAVQPVPEAPKQGGPLTTGQDPDEGTEPWYRKMFAACQVNADKKQQVANTLALVMQGYDRYLAVAKRLGAVMPENFAWILGAIHFKEASCNFAGVLHNGERIIGTGKKTSIVPIGRGPFATWEDAAVDAIGIESSRWKKLIQGGADIGDVLYALERYNGTGYITGAGKAENSPYLWACSNVNDGFGKYVSDGKFDANASTGSSAGAAVILKELWTARKFIANV